MDLSYIRPPVEKELLKQELSERHFLRRTNYGNKEIYITTAHRSPNVMQEIGRLREISFASEGGGTGQPVDIDEFDTLPDPYCFKQLIVWDPVDEEIVGGYRFIHGTNMFRDASGEFLTPMAHLFHYSDEFIEKYLPYTIEMARAWVQPAYQPSHNLRKGMYSLDNLWDGLGAVGIEVPETHYFMGKVTAYPDMNPRIKALLFYYLKKHFPDRDGLVRPRVPLQLDVDLNELDKVLCGNNFKEDFQIIQREARAVNEFIPPLFNAYINLSPTMRVFGSAFNEEFGNTDETGIIVKLFDIFPEKKGRYFETYQEKNRDFDRGSLFKINLQRLPWWRNHRHDNPTERENMLQLKKLKQARVRSTTNFDSDDIEPRKAKRMKRKAKRRSIRKKIAARIKPNNQEN